MKRPGIATAEARSARTAVEQGVGEDPICDTGWYAGSNGRAAGSGSKNGITQYSGDEVRFQQFATRHLHAAGAPDTIAASCRSDAFGEASNCRPKATANGSGKMSAWPASMPSRMA